jgi:F-type H+-transporting ATPase subunit b
MLIDWFTVGAQTLNFLILVWLMKRFLYQPILRAVDEREKRIAAELADADAKRAEAQQIRAEFQQKNEVFDQQRAAMLTLATDDANAERLRLLDTARLEADALQVRQLEAQRNEAYQLNQSIGRCTQQAVFAIARKALADLAELSLEQSFCNVFMRRLAEMDVKSRQGFSDAFKTAAESALVRCTFDLSAEQQTMIQNALNVSFSAEIPLQFVTAPQLIGGIELSTQDWKLAWSIADYLQTLENSVNELSAAQAGLPAKPESMAAAQAAPETTAGVAGTAK